MLAAWWVVPLTARVWSSVMVAAMALASRRSSSVATSSLRRRKQCQLSDMFTLTYNDNKLTSQGFSHSPRREEFPWFAAHETHIISACSASIKALWNTHPSTRLLLRGRRPKAGAIAVHPSGDVDDIRLLLGAHGVCLSVRHLRPKLKQLTAKSKDVPHVPGPVRSQGWGHNVGNKKQPGLGSSLRRRSWDGERVGARGEGGGTSGLYSHYIQTKRSHHMWRPCKTGTGSVETTLWHGSPDLNSYIKVQVPWRMVGNQPLAIGSLSFGYRWCTGNGDGTSR